MTAVLYWMGNMKKRICLLALTIAFPVRIAAQTKANAIFLSGGPNYHFFYGTESEYEAGVNDFPVTPAHTPLFFGVSYARLGRMIGGELEVRWTTASNVVLRDPADGDSLEVKAGPHLSLLVNFLLRPWRGKFQPFVLAGGGLDILFSKDAEYTTAYGYPISIPAPDLKNRTDAEFHAGAGFFIYFGRIWGLRIEGRTAWILD
jgi:hypothetical protein